jgi:hypothetical protein
MTQGKILVFVEDPGAANFVAPLLPRLREAGLALEVYAVTKGAEHLAQMGEPFDVPRTEVTASELVMHSEASALLVGTSENPDSLGLALVDAARAAGITSIGMVDGPANAAWRFRGRSDQPLAHAPEWIFVADEPTRDAFVGLGHSVDKVLAVGHPDLDRIVAMRRELEAAGRDRLREALFPGAANRTVIVFVAEVSDGLNPSQFLRSCDYTLCGRGGSDRRTDIVLEEVLDAIRRLSPRPYLVLRLHPKNRREEFRAYEAEIDQVSDQGSPHALVFSADAVVGMSSWLLTEARVLGSPVLSVLPREEERAWLQSACTQPISCVTSRSELDGALRRLLIRATAGSETEETGSAVSRVVDAVLAVAGRDNPMVRR